MSRLAAVLLAAGRSSRMEGENKLLAAFGDRPLVRRSAETALDAGFSQVFVVTGHQAREIETVLAGLDVTFLYNPLYADGLSSSLRRGFEAAARGADGVLVMLADQPLLQAVHLRALADAFRPAGRGSVVVARGDGRRGNPVILPAGFLPDILALEGDVGAKALVAAREDLVADVEIGSAALLDVDKREALESARAAFEKR